MEHIHKHGFTLNLRLRNRNNKTKSSTDNYVNMLEIECIRFRCMAILTFSEGFTFVQIHEILFFCKLNCSSLYIHQHFVLR